MAVKSLRHWQGPGLSGFCTEDLQEWLEALEETFGPMLPLRVNRVSSPMDDDNLSPWDTWWSDFVNFSWHVYTTGELLLVMSHCILVLIPKNRPGMREMGLLEVTFTFQVTTSILNTWLSKIELDPALHGFWACRGTGTAILDTKLRMQPAAAKHCCLLPVASSRSFWTWAKHTIPLIIGAGLPSWRAMALGKKPSASSIPSRQTSWLHLPEQLLCCPLPWATHRVT